MYHSTVLIAGAGPTGLALACDLRVRGIDATILEKLDEPPRTTRALGVQPRGRQILDRLGVLEDLTAEAIPQTSFDIIVNRQLAVRVGLNSSQGKHDDGVLRIPQTSIERSLRKRLQDLGGEILWGHEIVNAFQKSDGVDVVVRRGDGEQTVRAAWLIGCDGAHSVCRKIVGAEFHGTVYSEPFLLGDVRLDWKKEHGTAIYLRKGQVLTLASLPDGNWRLGVALPANDPLAKRGAEALTAE